MLPRRVLEEPRVAGEGRTTIPNRIPSAWLLVDAAATPGRAPFPARGALALRTGAAVPALAVLEDAEAWAAAVRRAPVEALEHAVYTGALERWIGTAGDRRAFASVRALARRGEALRAVLQAATEEAMRADARGEEWNPA